MKKLALLLTDLSPPMRDLFRESSFCALLLWYGDVINNFFQMHYAKIYFSIAMHVHCSTANILETTPARKQKFFAKVIGGKRSLQNNHN